MIDRIQGQNILLVGDISTAFKESNLADLKQYRSCASLLDAVEMSSTSHFSKIAIVMANLRGNITAALRAIRQADSDTEILLLAQMHQEPQAIKLVQTRLNGTTLADGYEICPADISLFYDTCPTEQIPEQKETFIEKACDDLSHDRSVKDKIEKLEELATVDELTGLKNRRYIWEFGNQVIERAKKENEKVTLLVFDIDDFKKYNDIYGHSVGDEILKQAAILIKHCCRNHDVVGRIGGDEFVAIFWDDPQGKNTPSSERRITAAEHPREPIFISKRFRSELSKTGLTSLGTEGKGELTISGGLASFPLDGMTIKELFQSADKALYEAKRSGKNSIYLVGKAAENIEDIK